MVRRLGNGGRRAAAYRELTIGARPRIDRRGVAARWRASIPAVKGLVAGLVGGLICATAHTPLPWLVGPLLAVAACRFAGGGCAAPTGGRQVGQWIIGTALGLYFTPTVAATVLRFWWVLLLAGAFALALGYLCGFLLDAMTRVGRTTAVFASVPGGAAEMSVLGERYGARVEIVAAAQSLRIMLVVLVIPTVFAILELHGSDPFQPGISELRPGGLAALLVATLAGAMLLDRLRVPNAYVLGALAISIPLTVAQIDLSAVPRALTNAAQLLLGCALGARFDRGFLRHAPLLVAAVAASVAAAMLFSAIFAAAIAAATDIPFATAVLATSPGGIAEMAITAKVLDLGVPLVTAFHVTRVVILLTCTAPVFAWLRRRRARRGPVA